jgi:hypothetical protein
VALSNWRVPVRPDQALWLLDFMISRCSLFARALSAKGYNLGSWIWILRLTEKERRSHRRVGFRRGSDIGVDDGGVSGLREAMQRWTTCGRARWRRW